MNFHAFSKDKTNKYQLLEYISKESLQIGSVRETHFNVVSV